MITFVVTFLLKDFRCLASLLLLSVCQYYFNLGLPMCHEICSGG